jgi:hypothetical protein
VVQPISANNAQEINFGDISNTDNPKATISLDKSSYAVGDTAKVTVNDPEANIDSKIINTVQVHVTSDIFPEGIFVTLTETSPDSGIFEGTFGFTNTEGAGDFDTIGINPEDPNVKIKLFYDASHPRTKIAIDGVTQGGIAEVSEVLITDQLTRITNISNISPLTRQGINLSLADGAQLVPATNPEITQVCDSVGGSSAQTCGGNITITMSYANIPLSIGRIPDEGCGEFCSPITETVSPLNLTIYEWVGQTWIPLDLHGPVTINEDAKTVTAISPFGPGIFIMSIKPAPDSNGGGDGGSGAGGGGGGSCDASDSILKALKASTGRSGSFTAAAGSGGTGGGSGGGPGSGGSGGGTGSGGGGGCGGGGGGGGLALPGDGVVLDLIVGVIQTETPSPSPSPSPSEPTMSPSNPPSATRSIPDPESDTNLNTTSFSTSSSNPITDSNPNIETLGESGSLASSTDGKRNDNFTIFIPGEGNVTLNYLTLTSGENLTVSPLKTPSELAALNITNVQDSHHRSLSTLNNTHYSIISTVFSIGPNDAKVNGTITVSIPYKNTSLSGQNGEQDVRMFQYTGSAWEDVTSRPPASANSVTGSVSSVGPVVAAARSTLSYY